MEICTLTFCFDPLVEEVNEIVEEQSSITVLNPWAVQQDCFADTLDLNKGKSADAVVDSIAVVMEANQSSNLFDCQ